MTTTKLFEMSNVFPLKVRQKLNYKYFYKKSNCSTESSGRVEGIFDNFARNFSETFWKKFDAIPKTIEKLYSFWEKFSFHKMFLQKPKLLFWSPGWNRLVTRPNFFPLRSQKNRRPFFSMKTSSKIPRETWKAALTKMIYFFG